jgi:hypothetical protein
MKRTANLDPLEETMQNPDLPPIRAAALTDARASRRGLWRSLAVGALLLVAVLVALRV